MEVVKGKKAIRGGLRAAAAHTGVRPRVRERKGEACWSVIKSPGVKLCKPWGKGKGWGAQAAVQGRQVSCSEPPQG